METNLIYNEDKSVIVKIYQKNGAWAWELRSRVDAECALGAPVISTGYKTYEKALAFANKAIKQAERNMTAYSTAHNIDTAMEDFAYHKKALEILEYFGVNILDIVYVNSPIDYERIRDQIINTKTS